MKEFLLFTLTLALAAAPLTHAQTTRRAAPALAVPPVATRPAANPNFRLISAVVQRPNGATAWLDSARYTFSRFTATNRPRLELRERAAVRGATLAVYEQERRQYNAAGDPLADSTITYTAGVPDAVPSVVRTFAYNAQGRLLEEVYYRRTNTALRAEYRDTYTYNAQGQSTVILFEDNRASPGAAVSWRYSSQRTRSYNALGQLVQEDYNLAPGTGGATTFRPYSRDLFTYNAAGHLLTQTAFFYDNNPSGTYTPEFRNSFTYNATNLPTEVLAESYRASAWVPRWTYIVAHDADSNTTMYVLRFYNNGVFVNEERTLLNYQRILAAVPARALQAALVALPNPAAAGTAAILRYDLPTAAPVAVAVFDAAGRTVAAVPAAAQAAGPHTLALPALATPGLYLVRLSAGAQSQTVRLAVE